MAGPEKQKTLGFTLIELSIVLLIIASLIAMMMFSIQARTDASKVYLTKQNMQMIMDAMDRYVEIYGHIPCPAQRVARTNSGYGRSREDASGDCTYSPTAITNLFIGDIPFKALGLDAQTIVDGWGNRMDYIVTGPYTLTANFTAGGFDNYFNIKNQGGTTITPNKDVVYALISHGPNSYGGFRDKTATQLSYASASGRETNNADGNTDGVADIPATAYYQAEPYLDTSSGSKNFDDILVYKTRWQLPTYINQ